MRMLFAQDGSCRFVYNDDLASIAPGTLKTKRASHVEPTDGGLWYSDMSPVGGPILGPFETRLEALAREADWLDTHDIPIPRR